MTVPHDDTVQHTALMSKLEKWLMTQENLQASVADAARHFGVEAARIEQAAQDHPWMGIDRALGVWTVFLDGE